MEIQKVRRTKEQWQELVLQWETSHLNAKAWCLEHAVAYESFIIWRKRLKGALHANSDTPKTTFVELSDASTISSGIEIHCRSLSLSLSKDFDSSTLLRCLQVLEKI